MTAPTRDAVAQARHNYDVAKGWLALASNHREEMMGAGKSFADYERDVEDAWAEVLAAVRAECAAKVLNAPRYGRYDHEILPMEYGNLLKRDELLAALEARAERAERERDGARRICDAVAEALGFAKTYDTSLLAGAVKSRSTALEFWISSSNDLLAQLTESQATIRTLTERLNDAEAARREAVADADKYAPAAPAGVRLGEFDVRWDGTHWLVRRKGEFVCGRLSLYEALREMHYDATDDQLAALLALAAPQEGQ